MGPFRSSLVAVALDLTTFAICDRESAPRLSVRDRERVMEGANPIQDQNLYQILCVLSALTGDQKYAEDADRTLGWFLEHCAYSSTNLYAWGEHMGWDFQQERGLLGRLRVSYTSSFGLGAFGTDVMR